MSPVLVVVKLRGCPACVNLDSKLSQIVDKIKTIPSFEGLRVQTFELVDGRFPEECPVIFNSVIRFPMSFLVPGNVWDAVSRKPLIKMPLTGSTIFNGRWEHLVPVFLEVPKYIWGEINSYYEWALETSRDPLFVRSQKDIYPAVPFHPSSKSKPKLKYVSSRSSHGRK